MNHRVPSHTRAGGLFSFRGCLLFSLIFHSAILGFFEAASKAPFGGSPSGVIVVNLVPLGAGQKAGKIMQSNRQSEAAHLINRTEDEKKPSAVVKAGLAEAHADVGAPPPAPPSVVQEGDISGEVQGGEGGRNPLLFGAGGVDKIPAIMELKEIEYPQEARRTGLEGEVVVKILITREGKVETVEAVRSTDKFLERAVINAVKQWRFEPPTVRGRPVSIWMITPFRFKLK